MTLTRTKAKYRRTDPVNNEEMQTSATAGGVHSVVARSITKGRRLVVGAGAVAVISLVAACGGGGGIAAASTTPTTSGPPPAFRPAASGTIASVAGNVLEVQSPQSGQTTVNVSSKTVITATVSVTESVVVKGTCISATGTKGTSGSVDATAVALFAATKGQCTRGGFGAGGAGGGFGAGGTSGAFTTRGTAPAHTSGTRPPTARAANFASASGKVTSKSGTKIGVEAVTVTFSKGKATTKTGPKTVNVSKSTKYTKTEKATASALKVGECVTATGSTNNIGAVSATTLIVTPATSSGCSLFGFGGFGGRPGGTGGGAA
jgi:hypothetical protein